MARFSETARERELFRYYQPTSHDALPPTTPTLLARSSSDTALTAFAQLGALRLNATRCIISLVGSKSEYVLAEASKTLSLQDDGTHDAGDQLLHGEGAVKARSGIGPVLIALLSGERERGHVEVKDIRADERFKDLPGNVAEVARSLICLPLRSARGYVIGLYRVLDETPREEGFSEVEIGFLRDMAATTMDHIESSRVRQRHDRAEKMVKALAIYLEGGESLREWWLNQATEGRSIQQSSINEQNRRGFSLSQQADTELGVQDGPDGYSAANMEDLEENFDSLPITYSRSATSRSVHSSHRPGISERQSSFSTTDPVTYSSNLAFVNTGFASSENSSVTNSSALPPTLASRLADPDTQLPGKELQEALLSADVKQTFSRASNLLREAIDLDGVAFYDASVGSFGARSLQEQKAPGAHTLDSVPETTSSGSDFPNTNASKIGNGDSAVSAGLLGYSTRTRSSLRSHADSEMLGRFSEPLLKVLAKRYPHGKVFNLDDDGSISSSDVERSSISRDPSAPKSRSSSPPQEESTETKERKARKQLSRQAEAAAILEVIPGARSVAWFPLWDAASERWYAGALIWSLHATRVFTPEDELTYMAAWGNSIMAEVSRLSALVASRMKVDFVSSISHELRSPLHGILASVEFLQEEEDMPAMQADMISTIQSCGKTLLDTINHVLDFAKIIKKTSKKSPKTSQKRPSGSRRENPDNMKELSDICILAEEVVDSVYAGRRSRDNTAPRSPFPTPLLVILDISHESTWKYKVNIGAFRRVLMNLFSNALKYTEAGFVKVALSLKHEPSREGKARPILQITIIDSGKGISEEFLKDHLYTAFKQEDALSAGTGLGLSIVRQVLVDVRGAIEIESELGAGTTAAVSIPVRASSRASPDGEVHAIAEIREKMRGRRALVANEDFNVYPKMSDAPTGILSPEAQAMIYLKSSVESMLTDWFDMDMESPSGDAASPDVVVLMASDNIGEKITSLEETHSESAISNSMVVVALCDASYRCRNSTTQGGTRIFYLRLPATPHKLAKILKTAFCKPTKPGSDPTSQPAQPSTTNPAPIRGILAANNNPTPRPSLQHRKSSKTTSPSSPAPLPPNTYNTLLVEDNVINLKLLSHYMTRLSQNYATATNGHEAVLAYTSASGPFDVVFMDLQMPRMDGLAAAREIRKWEVENGVKPAAVVALTGAASGNARLEAFGSGMDLFLVKPVKMSVLMDVMVRLREGGRAALRGFG